MSERLDIGKAEDMDEKMEALKKEAREKILNTIVSKGLRSFGIERNRMSVFIKGYPIFGRLLFCAET